MKASIILAGLIAMFSSYLGDLEEPRVTWISPELIGVNTPLGHTTCGYRTDPETHEKIPICVIRINQCLQDNPKELIDTYLHELAHYIDWVSDEDWDDHSGQWKKLVKKWDLVSSNDRATRRIKGCN